MKCCLVALVTPMHENTDVDYVALRALIDWHLSVGTEGFVILGTTGEAPTLTQEEKSAIISTSLDAVKKRAPVIVGTGTYNTKTSIENTMMAEKLGADGVLVINPYYNKPTQKGLFYHFKAIHDASTLPIILYNHPGRTGGSLTEETIAELSQCERIIGIKDTTSDYQRIANIRKLCGKDFLIFSACDDNTVDFMRAGGDGIISVTANIAPEAMKTMVNLAAQGNFDLAEKEQKKLMPLHEASCLESNPIPVKWALHQLGKIPKGIRLPLTPLELNHQITFNKILRGYL